MLNLKLRPGDEVLWSLSSRPGEMAEEVCRLCRRSLVLRRLQAFLAVRLLVKAYSTPAPSVQPVAVVVVDQALKPKPLL